MRIQRVMIAAPGSGSGKTTVTCALLETLKQQGIRAVSYKCGPDYIDPMFHEKVLGIPSKNLDTFFTGEEETRALFLQGRTADEFAVLEGVMGLYDGLGGIREEGSSYHLAKVTGTPIILVVDARGMGRSVIPLIAGFLAYDSARLIRGVILNRMSGSYYGTIGALIEKECGIAVLGYLAEQKQLRIGSRHLGLTLPDEIDHLRTWAGQLAELFRETVSVERILEIAGQARELASAEEEEKLRDVEQTAEWKEKLRDVEQNAEPEVPRYVSDRGDGGRDPIIAVARDEAFCFYYVDNLSLLEKYGAKLRYFSPLHDSALPTGSCGLLLGGGYPELHAEALSANASMRAAIRRAAADGMPVVAECGGFMYLHSAIVDEKGEHHEMAEVLPGICRYAGRLVRFGYVELEEKNPDFLPRGGKIKGHEFHYYDSSDNGSDCTAVKPVSGKRYPCVIAKPGLWAGFPHLYYPSNPEFAKAFIKKAAEYKRRKEGDILNLKFY